ncbi:MAG: DUF5320 domain-containing protein [Veillonellaceae bacterium]|jgi:hypothetical protein|nr:DUF5320 domain-containing protein [Veillonellaceae bacterium]
MPRGDGTGPLGTGPQGRRRGGCQQMGFGNGLGSGLGRRLQNAFGMFNNTANRPESLESQAEKLEAQAAHLRNLTKQNRKTD